MEKEGTRQFANQEDNQKQSPKGKEKQEYSPIQQLDYEKLANQVKRLSILHHESIKKLNDNNKKQERKKSLMKNVIKEEEENIIKVPKNKETINTQRKQGLSIMSVFKIEPKSRKISLKKEIEEKALKTLEFVKSFKEQQKNLHNKNDNVFQTEVDSDTNLELVQSLSLIRRNTIPAKEKSLDNNTQSSLEIDRQSRDLSEESRSKRQGITKAYTTQEKQEIKIKDIKIKIEKDDTEKKKPQAGSIESPDIAFIFQQAKKQRKTNVENYKNQNNQNNTEKIVDPYEAKPQSQPRNRQTPSYNQQASGFNQKLLSNVKNHKNMIKSAQNFCIRPEMNTNLSKPQTSQPSQQKIEEINKLKYELFNQLLDTVDTRIRETVLKQESLFNNTSKFQSNQRLKQINLFNSNSQPILAQTYDKGQLQSNNNNKNKEESKENFRVKDFNVQIIHDQFNISNLPYVKYDSSILCDKKYQFKIIKDEIRLLYDKLNEFKNILTFQQAFKSIVIFQTLSQEPKLRFNLQFEELIGLLIQIINIILLKFGNEPAKIGIKDIKKLFQQKIKVINEVKAFQENQTFFLDIVDVYKKSFDAYYIMTKMLGFQQIPLEINQQLQQFVCRSRLVVKELIEDFKSQDLMLNKEFQKEKMYIEGMLMRGEDLYNYKFRSKLELPDLQKQLTSKNKNQDKKLIKALTAQSNLNQFLEQQSVLYAKRCKIFYQISNTQIVKRIQCEQQMKQREEEIQKQHQERKTQKDKQNTLSLTTTRLNSENDENKKIRYNRFEKIQPKLQTQPVISGKKALELKDQIKQVLKYMHTNTNRQKKGMKGFQYQDNISKGLYISNETREYISNMLTTIKLKNSGKVHPNALEKLILLNEDDDMKPKQTLPFVQNQSTWQISNTKALKEIEKAVRVGLTACKEQQKLQLMKQSLYDIQFLTNPKENSQDNEENEEY